MANPVGLDPAQMNDLAAKFAAAQAVLNGSRSAVQQGINQAWWAGPAADRFRNDWNSTLSGQLRTCADHLSLAATELRRQRQEQIAASADGVSIVGVVVPDGSGSGSGTSVAPGAPSSSGSLEDFVTALGSGVGPLLFGTFATMIEHGGTLADLAGYMQRVSGYTRGLTVVDDYFRWAPGMADTLKPLLGNADDLAKGLGKAGSALAVLGVVIGGLDQWFKDSGNFELDELIGRTGGRVVFEGAGALLGTLATSAAIGAWGGPVGLGVGLAVGAAWWALSEFTPVDDWVIGAGGWVGYQVGNLVSDVADGFGDLASGVADTFDDAVDWLSPW
jgi:hypothetical protein